MGSLVIEEVKQYVLVDDGMSTVLEITDEVVSVLEVGIQGPAGPTGVGSDRYYTQDFSSANSVSVTHNFNKFPAVTVFDSAGDEVEGSVEHNDLNSLTVAFSAPFSGKVICN